MSWKMTVVFPPESRSTSPPRGRNGGGDVVGKRTLVAAGHQSAQWHNFRAGVRIEAHNGGAGSVQVSEHADAAAKADALAYPKLALRTAVQRLVHLVCLPPHLGRGIPPGDPFGRFYGTGTVTVVIGVVTVTVVPEGMVTVAAVIGVLTVTVAATVGI